jgi:general secretion pathway protein D
VLSTPRIFTTNNVTAEINISQSIPYVLSQTTDAVSGAILYNYSFLDVGIVLTVTPRITQNGYVTMDVTQTANDLVSYTSFNAPIVNQREADTTVSVKDGETIVLGGIIQNQITKTINKIPILGDLPILGNLFRDNSTTKNKTELLVFLTPRVVRNTDEARKLRQDTEKDLNPATAKNLNQLGAGYKVSVGPEVPPAGGVIAVPANGGAPVVTPAAPGTTPPPPTTVPTPTAPTLGGTPSGGTTQGVPPTIPAPAPVVPQKVP